MAELEISDISNERGRVQSVRHGERRASLFTSTALTAHPRIGEQVQALVESIARVIVSLQVTAPDLTSTGLIKTAEDQIAKNVRSTFKALIVAIPVADDHLTTRRASLASPFFPDHQPSVVRVEQRQWLSSLNLAARMDALRADPALTAAVVEGGFALSGLPADLFARLQRDLTVANATRVLAGQREFRTTPNASDPVGGKPDPRLAQAAGEELIAAFEAEEAVLAETSAVLTSIIDIVAILTDRVRDDAFKFLVA